MKRFNIINTKVLLLILLLPILTVLQGKTLAQTEQGQSTSVSKGTVVEIIEEREIDTNTVYQKLKVRTETQKELVIENDPQTSGRNISYKKGDKVMVEQIATSESGEIFVISDFNRTPYLIFIFLVFSALSILIARKKGFYSLMGMAISFFIIFKFTLPQISAGKSPFFITVATSFFIIPITFYLSHGINRKTHVSILSTIITLTVTVILTSLSISAAKLTGFASEEAYFLQITNEGVNMKGILLAGIIIGFLGILDDVTISQANIVIKLKKADPNLGTLALYNKAMDVGRDHIASMINTLILVYSGASLPLLLLFIDNPQPFGQTINREIIADEIIRTLLGSIGLILAVPLTTFITSLVADIE